MSAAALCRLSLAHARRHRLRTIATVAAIAIAVAVVGFSVRGSQVAAKQAAEQARQFGRFDIVVSPRDLLAAPLDRALVELVRADPAVKELDPAVKTRVRVVKPELPQILMPLAGIPLMGTSATAPPLALADGRWLDPAAAGREAVVSSNFRERAGLRLGDALVLGGNGGEQALTIVGVVAVPPPVPGVRGGASHLAEAWVDQTAAAAINGFADRPTLLLAVLKDPEKAGEVAKAWRTASERSEPAVRVRSTQDEADDPMGGQSSGMQQLVFANVTVGSFLAAGFIAYLSLSVGVRARLRQYAILRALALSGRQLAAMVFAESLAFAAAGLAAGIGLLYAAMALCRSLAAQVPAFAGDMYAPALIDGTTIAVCAISVVAGAAAAAILPAWQVLRIRPADILGGQAGAPPARFPWVLTGIGLALIVANPALILLGGNESVRGALEAFKGGRGFGAPLLGSSLMIIGLGLVTPLGLRLCEALLHRPAAALLGLDGRLLRQQLTGQLWRAVGTTVALGVGLTMFVASLVWGYSMLVPFMPTDAMPRLQVAILPAGLEDQAVPELLAVEGVDPQRSLPVATEQPRLSAATLARPGFAHVDEQQRHVLVMGVDPQRALLGDDPMFRLDFVAGDAASAARAMAAGDGCIIPDHFATQCGLALGDTFTVEVPEREGAEVTYTVAGIASIPGWNWMTKFSEIRRRSVRALALVFADHDRTRAAYGLTRTSFFWMDPARGADGRDAGKVLAGRIEPIAKKHARVNLNVPRAGRTAVNTQYVNVVDREDVKDRISGRAGDVIGTMRWMPLAVLIITSLAVCNTILASVRARWWQFGILRGIGMTRGQLVRLILGESLLLWLAASVLSLGAGILLAWAGTRLSTLFFFFAGRIPPLVVPWGELALGFVIAFALCLTAGLIPALVAGSREPLRFIQGGRLSS